MSWNSRAPLLFLWLCGAGLSCCTLISHEESREKHVRDGISALVLTASSSSVAADGTVYFSAQVSCTGSPSVSYSWSVASTCSASSYASLSAEGNRATVVLNNTGDAPKILTVKVNALAEGDFVQASADVIVASPLAD